MGKEFQEVKLDTKRERLKEMYLKYELHEQDIFNLTMGKKKIPIITRTGIEKIMAKDNIVLNYDVVRCEPEFCAIKCVATKGDRIHSNKEITIETFATAGKLNCKSNYYLEMAEKRSKARAVLQITEFYSLGVYGEVEADEFKREGFKNEQTD
tara:strand:- start:3607 stop:4065 length:459 start_codon:yes stop_codon:yes gene_type:complete